MRLPRLFAYCAKCPVRLTGCRHGLPGPMTRYLPQRHAGPYRVKDYIGLSLPLAVLVGTPQPYLWRAPLLLVVFWGLMGAGVLEIRRHVCTGCANWLCPLQKSKSRQKGTITGGSAAKRGGDIKKGQRPGAPFGSPGR